MTKAYISKIESKTGKHCPISVNRLSDNCSHWRSFKFSNSFKGIFSILFDSKNRITNEVVSLNRPDGISSIWFLLRNLKKKRMRYFPRHLTKKSLQFFQSGLTWEYFGWHLWYVVSFKISVGKIIDKNFFVFWFNLFLTIFLKLDLSTSRRLILLSYLLVLILLPKKNYYLNKKNFRKIYGKCFLYIF